MLKGKQYINLTLIILILIVLWLGVTLLQGTVDEEVVSEINNFEECVEAGNPVMESYPEQCSANGETFVRDIGNELEKSDLIRIDNPRPGDEVSSPLRVTGEARGYWYFEASFPLEIQDSDGNVLAEHYATAILDPNDPDSTWMTEDFVPFESTLEFEAPEGEGTLILRRSNASGLPENDDELIVPIVFE